MSASSPARFLRLLILLRWLAIAGQSLAIAAALLWLKLPLQITPLVGGVLALVLFNLWAEFSLRRGGNADPLRLGMHLAVDIGVLSWLLYFSGGGANPFVSLYLVPVALVAVALPRSWTLWVTALSVLAYLAIAVAAPALPHVHGAPGLDFDLHLWGMAANFVLSALLFVFALGQLAAMLADRERELSRLRERAARNEGIVALGAHAAALAHALNTPLGSLQLILDDLDSGLSLSEFEAELGHLRQLAGECRQRVQELVAHAQHLDTQPVPAARYLHALIERWRLTRPNTALVARGLTELDVDLRPQPLLEHLLLALLNNAADASHAGGEERIELGAAIERAAEGYELLSLSVRDFGPGLSAQLDARSGLFSSTKPQGLGLGLALSHAAVEHFGGSLSLRPHPSGGSVAVVRLPLAALQLESAQ